MKTRANLHAMKWKVLTIVRKTKKKAKVTLKLVIKKNEPICENSLVTQMDVAVALLRWSSKYPGVSEAAVSDLLSLLQSLMSLAVGKRIKFPNTFKKARALLNNYITETKQYQICSNECILYAGENNYTTECPTCGEERYARDSPARTFSVIPLIPRLAIAL